VTARFRPAAGTWWKFDRYELRNGYIVPARSARLTEYNPWADYLAARESPTRERFQPAYLSLFHLLDRIKTLPAVKGNGVDVDDDGRRAILEWCGQHGLLGLLHHMVQTVVLPARHVKQSWATGPVRVQYVREPVGWRTQMIVFDRDEEPWQLKLDEGRFRAAWREYSQGTVIDNDDHGEVIAARTLTDYHPTWFGITNEPWSLFFPSIPRAERRTFAYPPPLSEPFWRLYGEPLDAFLAGARLLGDALEVFAEKETSILHIDAPIEQIETLTPTRDESPDLGWLYGVDPRSRAVLHSLHLLTSPLRMTFGIQKLAQLVWVAPSLLSAFGAMMFEDIVAARPRTCAECRTVFISPQPTVRFCSPRCLNTATKRTYRHKRRERSQKKKRTH
jgi:hypothetical protein